MMMWGVGEDDTKGRARPLPTIIYVYWNAPQLF